MTGPTEPQDPGQQQYPQQQYPQQAYPPQPYGQPQYPTPQYQPQYGQQPYPGQNGAPARRRLSPRVTERLAHRPVPRLGVSLAGVGVALAVVGVIVWGGSYVAEGTITDLESGDGGGSSSRHFLGAALALVVVAIGYLLTIRARRGPLATAGIVASALGVPVAVEFLTYSSGPHSSGSNPINSDAVVWISIIVWVATYLFVRGAQGHTFYLGSSLLLLWEYGLTKSAPSAADALGTQIALRFIPGDDVASPPVDTASLAGVSLTIGIVYYVIAWALDRSGRAGAGVAFALIGFPAVGVGIAALFPDLKQAGTGAVLLIAGLVLAYYGARFNRRFTTWIWALGAAGGAVLIVTKILSSGGTAIGISLIVLGAVFVAGGWLLARALDEPDDLVPDPGPAAGVPA